MLGGVVTISWPSCQPFPEVRHPSLSYSCQFKAVVLRAILPLVQCCRHTLSLPLPACVSANLELSPELLYIGAGNTVLYQKNKRILQRNWAPIACVLFGTFGRTKSLLLLEMDFKGRCGDPQGFVEGNSMHCLSRSCPYNTTTVPAFVQWKNARLGKINKLE